MPSLLDGSDIPSIIYGTARKQPLRPPEIGVALRLGYRAIDTASARRFHNEAFDGEALSQFLAQTEGCDFSRKELFIQAKFASPSAQAEPPWPYDVADDTRIRVLKSVLESSNKLGVDVIDVYFLHTPLHSLQETLGAWRTMEDIVAHGGIRYLGIANITSTGLRELWNSVSIRPQFVQNWFQKKTTYDTEVVHFCCENSIVYQMFGVFDHKNAYLLEYDTVTHRAAQKSITKHQALLQLLLVGAARIGLKLCLLDGSTNPAHMKENLGTVGQLSGFSDSDIESFLCFLGWL